MKRKIIKIDGNKCNGCGQCVPNCAEGAIKIINGKARLIGENFCDGLGACIGYCPENAIEIVEREAELYDEKKVMEYIAKGGKNVIAEHLIHLKEHNENGYLNQAIEYLRENNIEIPITIFDEEEIKKIHKGKCPGTMEKDLRKNKEENAKEDKAISIRSQLINWPIQLHLVMPTSAYYRDADVLIATDCVAYALPDFHNYLKNKSLAILCPKLDINQDIYIDKIRIMIDEAMINTLTIMTMEVPCCQGLVFIVKEALKKSSRKIPINLIIVEINGGILSDQWL